ncbi:HalOD1 output domain-containing protein [Natrarchaeobius oligotrophus]|uniref:Halobacterial output domain-containing protein n=1 Tax=Natrarchaeobius chitinivorans TaxID=1679083 RepID=A0A3N6MEZ5_NATCH|nr:HalOD1 output domain-containing protein [Natrarchaeobius chitinivorans]RQH02584.1 hypothetical protein EA472_04625 [Natrarchaeobius chitinivorans]
MSDSSTGAVVYESRYDWSRTTPSFAVVDTIAGLEGVDPVDLSTAFGTTLFDHVDPESLDTLVTADGNVSIAFPIDDYFVRIDGSVLCISTGRNQS